MTDDAGQSVYNYDKMGRINNTTKTIGETSYPLGFTFLKGRLNSITYPDNETVGYGYYDDGNLKYVGNYASYSNYDSLGRPRNVVYGNQVSTLFNFHPVHRRLTDLSVLSPTQGLLADRSYDYDNGGNIKSINDRLNTPLPMSFSSETYTPIRAHAIHSTGSGRVFGYDDNGNIENDGLRHITFDFENMPKSIGNVNFTYDGNGTRVNKFAPGLSTVYIDKLYECTNGVCGKYIFAGGIRIALQEGNQTLFYHPDHQGSTSVVTDGAGQKAESIHYFPFGETRQKSGTAQVNHMFTGQELDSETGLYNYNARIYDPDLGRFLTPDSIVSDPENPQSFNRYSYVLNDPLNLVDPTGNTSECTSGQPCTIRLNINGQKNTNPNVVVTNQNVVFSKDPPPDYSISGDDIAKGFENFGHSVVKAVNDVGKFFDGLFGGGHRKEPPPFVTRANNYAASGTEMYNNYAQNNSVNFTDPAGLSPYSDLLKQAQASNTSSLDPALVQRTIETFLPIGSVGKISGFTKHGINQAISRNGVGVASKEILDAVNNPIKTIGQLNGAIKYVGQNATVILNNVGNVITTWARNSRGWRIR